MIKPCTSLFSIITVLLANDFSIDEGGGTMSIAFLSEKDPPFWKSSSKCFHIVEMPVVSDREQLAVEGTFPGEMGRVFRIDE